MRQRSRLSSLLAGLRKDEGVGVLIYFTVMLPVIVGMIGLALEGGQFYHLNSDLQELADAAALAGAAELDGANDAITRATTKAETLLSNDPNWSNVAKAGLQIVDPPTFYSAISLGGDTATTDPTKATYIKVTTVTREVKPVFLALFGAGTNDKTSASAVAGSDTVACNVQPLMLCNPYEGTSDFHATAGQLFRFKPKGSNGSFSPGDFGLVDPPGLNSSGSKTIRNLLAATTPNFCYVDSISPRPGQAVQDVADGINVRFDMAPNGNTSGLDQTPAPDVIRGEMPDTPQHACNFNKYGPDPTSPASTTYTPETGALPGDTDMTANGNVDIGSTMDQTAANAYWNYHHGANWPANTTRFQAYCNELGLGSMCLGTNTPPTWAANTEAHAPQCAPANVRNSGDYKRRIISVAVVNCLAQNVKGNSATNLKSNKYGEFFITDPSPTSGSNAGTILGEFIRFVTPGSCDSNSTDPFCNALHRIVQLYR